jgi:hypothetical protein
MMKKIIWFVMFLLLVCFCGQTLAGGLPDSVQGQSRKDAKMSDAWKKFDKSGKVKFLQVQTTAPTSKPDEASKLDGSIGERIVEIKADPGVQGTEIVWSLKNKGPATVWVVAASKSDKALPIGIKKGSTVSLKTTLDSDRYTYIVVDNEGGKKTTFDIKAKCGETAAKTSRGKSMTIVWF